MGQVPDDQHNRRNRRNCRTSLVGRFLELNTIRSTASRYRWIGRSRGWSLDVSVAKKRYVSAVRADRNVARSFREAKTSSLTHRLGTGLARDLDRAGINTAYDRLFVAVRFVRSLHYVQDEAGTGKKEYPKYVPETLVENSGDCEDYATLLAGVLSSAAFGLDPVLVVLPGHAGIGINPAHFESRTPPVVIAGETEYVFVDTTNRVPIGEVPEPYESEPVIAVYANGWQPYNPLALSEHIKETVLEDQIVDPSIYL